MSMFDGGLVQGGQETGATGSPEGGNQQENQQQGNQQQGNQQVDWGSNDFLKNVDEADRPIVEKYLKSIDAGISRRFQGVHDQYRPYKELGEVDQLQQAMGIFSALNENPMEVYNALAEALKDELGSQGQQGNQGNQQQNGLENPELQGLPPELQAVVAPLFEKTQQQEQLLEAVAQFIIGQQTSQQEQSEDAELDSALKQLHDEFGEFDEDYVLTKAYANGGDLVAAIQSWNDTLQTATNGLGQMRNLPPILGGGGVIPQENSQSVKDLSRSQTVDLVANFLAAAQKQNT